MVLIVPVYEVLEISDYERNVTATAADQIAKLSSETRVVVFAVVVVADVVLVVAVGVGAGRRCIAAR